MTVIAAEQVTPRAKRLLAPNPGPMTLEGTNSWVLSAEAGEHCVVVDPGPADEPHLGRLAEQGDIRLILLTHHHLDHAEGASRLRSMTGAPIAAADPSLCVDSEPLRPGTTDAAGIELMVLQTPGHSSDSVCLLLSADHALLTGDTILGRGTTVVAHPDGRLNDYLDSLRRLRALVAEAVDVVLPGHGPVVQNPSLTLDFYLQHRRERLEQVRLAVAELGEPVTPMDVVRRVYADVDESLWPAAELSVRAQLEHLTELGA
jgi:glyoxylase-like metal-dependent hydrolase (beta-lactamase superfamily II)